MLPRNGKALSQPHDAWPVLALDAYLRRCRDKAHRPVCDRETRCTADQAADQGAPVQCHTPRQRWRAVCRTCLAARRQPFWGRSRADRSARASATARTITRAYSGRLRHNELAKLAHCGIRPLDACWLCSEAGTAAAGTFSARQRHGYTRHVTIRGQMALACPLHHSLNVLRVDCGARNHVALLTVQYLTEARLRPLAKALAPPARRDQGFDRLDRISVPLGTPWWSAWAT